MHARGATDEWGSEFEASSKDTEDVELPAGDFTSGKVRFDGEELEHGIVLECVVSALPKNKDKTAQSNPCPLYNCCAQASHPVGQRSSRTYHSPFVVLSLLRDLCALSSARICSIRLGASIGK